MAMGDTVDLGGNDWWTDNAPPSAASTGATPAEVTAAFQEVLGRAPNDQTEVDNWANGIGAQGIGAVRSALAATTEGQNYANRAKAPTAPAAGGDAALRAQLAQWASMPGADPSLASNPDYWVGAINSRGGLTDANRQFWQDASVGEKAFFRNPNRESGGSTLAGSNPTPYASNTNAPSPYSPATWTGGDYVAPTKPSVLQSPYVLPTQAELEASPGYHARLDAGTRAGERSAAAKGSILTGGTQLALNRDAQTFASNEYGNFVGETLGARQENESEYNADDANAFRNYLTRYGQFQDTNTQSQAAQASRYKQFTDANAQSLSDYITNVTTQRNAGNDLWSHLNDLYQTGAGLAGSSYKPGTV